jgi:uncharacterized protein
MKNLTTFVRPQYSQILERVKERRDKIQVIVGPRQVGKSTLMDQVLEKIEIPFTLAKADGVDPADTDWIHRTWESVRGMMKINNEPEHLLVIDEIQKINGWSDVVKSEWDWDTHDKIQIKLVLLGSSRLLLQSGLKESLAGRFELIRMGHWSYSEMNTAFGFSLDEYIYFGGYPGAANLISDEKRWKRYIRDSIATPAIEKDVLQTSRIYKPALMKQLFELGCKYSGKELSLTKVVGQLQDSGNVTTMASYLDILKQCQLICGLQKYASDDARKYNSIPKFLTFNNALMSAYHRQSFAAVRIDSDEWGRWVESAVGAHLLARAEEDCYEVYYWRERDDEVDFIVQSDDSCIAIEVKSGRRSQNRGLPLFSEKFHPVHSYIIGTGGIPFETFLQTPVSVLF